MEYFRLDEICNLNMGQSPKSDSYNQVGVGIPFFQGNADFGEIYPTVRVWCTEPIKVVEGGTLLISVRAPIGALNFVKTRSCIGRGIAGITAKNGYELKYIYYALRYKNKELNNKGTGSTFKAISKAMLGEVLIRDIPIERQIECLKELDLVQRIIFERKQQLQALDTLIKSRFVEMFGDEKRYSSISDLCTIITDGTHQPPEFIKKGIPFIFVSNIVTDKIEYDTEKFISRETYNELIKRTPIEIGDILLSTVGSYGHVAVVKLDKEFLFQRHIAYLKPRGDIVDSDYMHGALLAPDIQKRIEESVKGIAQKTLNLSEIKKMVIPVPDINRQKEFATFAQQTDKLKVA